MTSSTRNREARAQMLTGIRRGLNNAPARNPDEARQRISNHPRNLVPARATAISEDERFALFLKMAGEASASIDLLPDMAAVPEAVATYLASQNLPAELRIAPELSSLNWDSRPMLGISAGPARDSDAVSVTGSFAAIAETGSLALLSGPSHPTSLNFLPDTHIVVLRQSDVLGTFEEVWDHLRASGNPVPRTINLVTGPSRTGDIEMAIELGAHGPRRLHILIVRD